MRVVKGTRGPRGHISKEALLSLSVTSNHAFGRIHAAYRCVAVVTFFTTALVFSQTTPQPPVSETLATSAPVDQAPTITTEQLKELEPSIPERLLRSWQYQYQLLEQPAFLVVTSGGATETVPNPNKWLQQHSIVVQLSELFPRATSLPALVQTAYDLNYPNSKNPLTLGPGICPNKTNQTLLRCLASGGSFTGRLFSGAKLTFSVAQRDEVQQGFILPNLPISQSWGWNGQLDFDPTSLFVTSTSWKNAVAVRAKSPDGATRTFAGNTSSDEHDCFVQAPTANQLVKCEAEFAKPRLSSYNSSWLGSLAAVAIPTFQLKALSQFDFIKQGGVLTESPFLQRSLKSMTFTWDLRRLIPTTTDKLAVGTLYAAAMKPTKVSDTSPASKLCVLISGPFRSYVGVGQDSTLNSCRGVAVALGSVDHYAVACAKDRSMSIGTWAGINEYPGERNIPDSDCGWQVQHP